MNRIYSLGEGTNSGSHDLRIESRTSLSDRCNRYGRHIHYVQKFQIRQGNLPSGAMIPGPHYDVGRIADNCKLLKDESDESQADIDKHPV